MGKQKTQERLAAKRQSEVRRGHKLHVPSRTVLWAKRVVTGVAGGAVR